MTTTLEMILRLVLSGVIGSLIGLQRMRHNKEAGLRTHFIVAVASTLIMLVSKYGFTDVLRTSTIVLDPSRIAAQIVSGIGFIGAGTIIFHRQSIYGLTTAAGLWATSAIGLSIGAGLYWIGIGTSLLVLVALEIFEKGEKKFSLKSGVLYVLTQDIDPVLEAVKNSGIRFSQIKIEREKSESNLLDITLKVNINSQNSALIDEVIKRLVSIPGTEKVKLN